MRGAGRGGWSSMLWLLVGLCLMGPMQGCQSCDQDDRLAELVAKQGGEVDRDTARTAGTWRKAIDGDLFHMGDGLRTGVHSTAQLALSPSGVARVQPSTLLRFLPSAPESRTPQVALGEGAVEIVAEHMDLEIHTPRAVAHLSRGSRLKLSVGPGRERFDLLVGKVTVAHEGIEQELTTERPLELALERALEADAASEPSLAVTEAAPAPEQQPAAQASSTLPAEAGSAATQPGVSLHGGARAELDVAIEPSTIHAAQLPVDVHVVAPPCPERPRLQLLGKSALLSDSFVLRLGAGRHRVRVLCAGAPVGQAQLTVKRDGGKIELPKRAQNVRVEADGRRYTVLYQNILPTVTFAWPGTHAGERFTLLVSKGKREQSFALAKPEHAVSGNVLGEGEHKFWFRDESNRSSKPSILRLSFDETARSAYLSSPPDGTPIASVVLVEGAALLRSKVSVAGTPLPVDGRGRFSSQVSLSPGQRSLAVRVDHPEGGVHYYLRRLR